MSKMLTVNRIDRWTVIGRDDCIFTYKIAEEGGINKEIIIGYSVICDTKYLLKRKTLSMGVLVYIL
jgi:hypothetical protein